MTRSDRLGGPTVLVISLSLLTTALPASASGGDEAAARALFTEGRKLAAAGDYAAACPRFADSYKLDPGIGTNFNLADCEEHLGHTASAWLRFLDVAAATKAAGQADRERVARARAATLEPRLSKLVIRVPSPAPGLVVRRDGDVVPQKVWGVALPIDPGEHAVEAAAPGKHKWTATTTISASPNVASIDVPPLEAEATALAPLGVKVQPATPAPAPGGPDQDDRRRIPRATLWLGAVGVTSLATGAVFALLMEHANSQAKSLCTLTVGTMNNVCENQAEFTHHAQTLSDAKRDRTLFYVGAGVGAASLIAGASWWWFTSRHPKGPLGVALTPMFEASGARVAIEASW